MDPTHMRESGELNRKLAVDGTRPVDAFAQLSERPALFRSAGRDNLCCAPCGIAFAILGLGGRE